MNREIAVPAIAELGKLEAAFNRLIDIHWEMPEPQARAFRRLLGGMMGNWLNIQMEIVRQYRDLDPYKHLAWMQAPLPVPPARKEGKQPRVPRARPRRFAATNDPVAMNRKIARATLEELRSVGPPLKTLNALIAQMPAREAKSHRKWLQETVKASAQLHAAVVGEYSELAGAKHLDWLREMNQGA